ncbi:MAG: ABC transporter permease, partial [Proteobacteria bacterium]|nr:ABC transporter permease [Pseudomonadota bacterium]
MAGHLVHRAVLSVPVLFGVLLLGFMLLQLVPGDVAQVIGGPQATPEVVEQIRRDLGLDRPL